MQIIQKLTVVSNPTRIFEVGTELNDREVIEIKQISVYVDYSHSIFIILDENEDLISSIENCPVIVEYQEIAIDDDKRLGVDKPLGADHVPDY